MHAFIILGTVYQLTRKKRSLFKRTYLNPHVKLFDCFKTPLDFPLVKGNVVVCYILGLTRLRESGRTKWRLISPG